MPGIRLRHPTIRSSIFTVEHPRKYMVPLMCSTCKHVHERKTYHLNLDSDGYVIVSEGVFVRLREIDFAGMEVVNEVKSPPPLQVGGNFVLERTPIVRHYLNGN